VIRSMTGFGRAGFEVAGVPFDVEVRCLNSRHLDVFVRSPRVVAHLESELRRRVQGAFTRGKVDLSVSIAGGNAPPARLEIDAEAAGRYVEAAHALHARHGVRDDLGVAALLALPSVARLVEAELPAAALQSRLLAAAEEALAAAAAMRVQEGGALEQELSGRLDKVLELADRLGERAQEVQAAVRDRLQKRAEQLAAETGLADEARLAHEIVLAADRLDVTEELVRLRSHVDQFRSVLAAGVEEPAGRRLEFLLQEMLRETNTAGSKGGDAPVAHLVVELKSELERIREQVLNVE